MNTEDVCIYLPRFQQNVVETLFKNHLLNVHTSRTNARVLQLMPKWRYQSKQAKCRKMSNISCTKSQNLNDSRLDLKQSLPNPLKPCVKSRMKM